jgi:hypothetical protein
VPCITLRIQLLASISCVCTSSSHALIVLTRIDCAHIRECVPLLLRLPPCPASLTPTPRRAAGVSPDAPTPKAVWGSPQALRNFSVVRKLEGRPWPTGVSGTAAAAEWQ